MQVFYPAFCSNQEVFSIDVCSVALNQGVFRVLGRQPKFFLCQYIDLKTTSLTLNNIWSNLLPTVKSGSTHKLIFKSHVQAINLVEMHSCPKLQLIRITFLLVLDHLHPKLFKQAFFVLWNSLFLLLLNLSPIVLDIVSKLRLQLFGVIVSLFVLSLTLFFIPLSVFRFIVLNCVFFYVLCFIGLYVFRFKFFDSFVLELSFAGPSWKWVVTAQGVYSTITTFLTFPAAGETFLTVHKSRNNKNDFETTALRQRNYTVLL